MKLSNLPALVQRRGFKAVCVVLLVAAVWLTAMSSISVLFLAQHNAYSSEGDGLVEEVTDSLLLRDAGAIWARMSSLGSWTGIPSQRAALEQELSLRFDPEDSNLRYAVYDAASGNLLFGSAEVTEDTSQYTQVQSFPQSAQSHTVVLRFQSEDAALQWFRQTTEDRYTLLLDADWKQAPDGTVSLTVSTCPLYWCKICLQLDKSLPAADKYGLAGRLAMFLARNRFPILLLAIVSFAVTLLLLSLLIVSAGRRPGSMQVFLHPWDRLPFDLYLAGIVLLVFLPNLLSLVFDDLRWTYRSDLFFHMSFNALLVIYRTVLSYCAVISGARRFKAGTLVRNTLLFRLLQYVERSICSVEWGRRFYFKILAAYLFLSAAELFFLLFAHKTLLLWIWGAEKVLLCVCFGAIVASLSTLEHGGRALQNGDVTQQIPTERLLPFFRKHGETLNGISEGMRRTLDEQTRSERMKAELIANVSHDLKTPLTSIINYVDLLKRAGMDSQEGPEYLEVLDRQAVRLKKLVVDLVEASQASSGCMPVEAELLDVNILLSQAAGEYAERMQAHCQQQILSLTEEPLNILADPKLLWRIFDNLLGNAMLYSPEGSRIYISTERQDGGAVILFRNVSSQRLNISPDELMERFVRGDASRNSEGSGLGLSIVRSLTELQGGSFSIVIDGDLFKAILRFPLSDQTAGS